MNRVLHIVAKDLRRLRGWVIGWLVILMVPVVVGGLLLRNEPTPAEWNWYGGILVAARWLQAGVAYLMAILLVQADRVVGTTAFWVTRPISGGRLLMAKMVTAGLIFVGGAVLLNLPWWWFSGLGARDIVVAVIELLPPTAAVVLPAMMIGALTDSLGRALLWSLILAALGVMMPMLFSLVMNTASPRAASDLVIYAVIGGGATLLAMAAAVTLLYQTRRYTRWLAMPAAGLAVVLLLGRFLPLVWRPANEPEEWRPERAAEVTVAYHDAYSRPGAPSRNRLERWDNAWIGFTLEGTAPDLIVEGVGARQRWSWPGGAHVGRDGRLNVLRASDAAPMLGFKWQPLDPETVEWWRQRSQPRRGTSISRPPNRPSEGIWLQANVPFPQSIAERLDREPAGYTGSLWITLLRPTIVNEIPLQPGSWKIGESHGMRIFAVEGDADAVVVRAVDTTPFSWLATYREWRYRGRWFGTRHDREFVQLNRVLGELQPMRDRPRSVVVAGVQLTWRELTSSGPRVRRGDRWEWRPGWMEDASVAFVRYVPESVFRRDVRVEDMRVRQEAR
jgi:hypothetical protein